MVSLRQPAVKVSWASARDAQAATAKRGKPSEKGKAVFGEDATLLSRARPSFPPTPVE
jgi:hypothetical protein